MGPRRNDVMGELRLVSVDADSVVRHAIADGEQVIGRAANVDVVVSHPSVSRRHARLRRRGPQLDLVDLRSSNGTFVNGRRIDRSTTVAPGDVVRVGAVELHVQSGAQAPTGRHAAVGFAMRRQSAHQIWNVGGDVHKSTTVVGEDDPWDELFQGTPAGRVLMILGLVAVIVGFALWMTFIFSGFAPPSGTDPFGWNPITDARRILGVPQPILGFALFAGGGLASALGAGLSRAQRRRSGDVVRPIRRPRRS